jgi:hypothetical protein
MILLIILPIHDTTYHTAHSEYSTFFFLFFFTVERGSLKKIEKMVGAPSVFLLKNPFKREQFTPVIEEKKIWKVKGG